ncbi:heparinase II/III family protein [Anaeromicrobium sediminis]|nr:heparinase II/III-family protein [Anaeromicrobium sediminis]
MIQIKNDITILENYEKNDLIKICDDILAGKIYVAKEFEIIESVIDDLWYNDDIKNRSWKFWIHSFIMIEYLTRCYRENENCRYMYKSLEILKSWGQICEDLNLQNIIWHDHATAIRGIILCKMYEIFNWEEKDRVYIEDIIYMHGKKLVSHNFYMKKHNHGLDQDIALYLISVTCKHFKESYKWKRISKRRLWLQLDNLYEYDGTYLEQSPEYAYIVLLRLVEFTEVMKKYEDKDYRNIENGLGVKLRYLYDICHPDNILPGMGDGEYKKIDFTPLLTNHNMEKLYDELEEKICRHSIYCKGGYASFKDFSKGRNTHLIFSSAFHSRVHKHHDDLSLILYKDNTPILIDSGRYNYNYNENERKYVVSSYAHNTVVVDEKNTDIKRLNIKKSGLKSYYIDDNIGIVSGVHCLYDGVVHERIVIYLSSEDILVIDSLSGYKEHKYDQVFNLHPNINCSIKSNILFGNNGETSIIIKDLLDGDNEIVLYNGQKEPLRGWSATNYNEFQKNYMYVNCKKGKKAKYSTYINTDGNLKINDFNWKEDVIKFKFKSIKYTVVQGKENIILIKNNKLIKLNSIRNEKLEEAMAEAIQFEYKDKYRKERNKRLKIEEQFKNNLGNIDIISIKCNLESPQPVDSKIEFECNANGYDLEYAWYIYSGDEIIVKTQYTKENIISWIPKYRGTYSIKAFVRNKEGNKKSYRLEGYIIK